MSQNCLIKCIYSFIYCVLCQLVKKKKDYSDWS